MIPLAVVVVLAVGCFLIGWMARAENGRGTPRPASSARRCAPPYDWAKEGDL